MKTAEAVLLVQCVLSDEKQRGSLSAALPDQLLDLAQTGTALLLTAGEWFEISNLQLRLGSIGETPSISFQFRPKQGVLTQAPSHLAAW